MERNSCWRPVTDCRLCQLKKAFRVVVSAGVERVWPWKSMSGRVGRCEDWRPRISLCRFGVEWLVPVPLLTYRYVDLAIRRR